MLAVALLGIGVFATRLKHPNGPAALGVWLFYCGFVGLVIRWREKKRGPVPDDFLWVAILMLMGGKLFGETAENKWPISFWHWVIIGPAIALFIILAQHLTRLANRRIERFHASQEPSPTTNP